MVGRSLDREFQRTSGEVGEIVLEASHLVRGKTVRDVSLKLRQGEIVGLTGLWGPAALNLRDSCSERIASTAVRSGSMDNPSQLKSPRDAIAAGICFLSEDRKSEGIIRPVVFWRIFRWPVCDSFSVLADARNQ